MRKVKLQMQMTINGYVAQPDEKNDWMTWIPDEEFTAFMISMLDTSDTLLLGRKTAESIIKFWENTANDNPARVDIYFDKILHQNCPKTYSYTRVTALLLIFLPGSDIPRYFRRNSDPSPGYL